jgi:hypothetical protein
VLLNARRHAAQGRRDRKLARAVRLDPASTARWFDGWSWRPREALEPPAAPSPTSAPRTWLLAVGWRRRGLIDPSDVPGPFQPAPG